MSDVPKLCPICGSMPKHASMLEPIEKLEACVDCPRCGRFLMHMDMVEELNRCQPKFDGWYRLSAWTREQTENGAPWPRLAQRLQEVSTWLPHRRVREQLDMLLHLVDLRTAQYGEAVPIDDCADAARLWTRGKEEILFLAKAAEKQGRLMNQGYDGHAMLRLLLTPEGFLHLEEMDRSDARNDRVFVAMWFDATLDDAYEHGIKAGIAAAGYTPVRLDREAAHGDRIDARILVEIRRSRAVLADATGVRPNVLYEAGFADGLGKPVVWTVHKGDVGKLPFDTRQLLHVVWERPTDLAKQLQPVLEHRLGIRTGLGAQRGMR